MKQFQNFLFYTEARRAARSPFSGPWSWPSEIRGG